MVDGPRIDTLLRWIPLLPLLAAVVHGVMLGLVRRSLPQGAVALLSCLAPIGSFLISCVVFWELRGLEPGARVLVDPITTWIGSGRFSADLAFLLDPLSAVMVLVVTGVGSLIHIYSIGYMQDDHREDKGFQRFFCYLNLFLFSMLMLVLADNLVLLFLGWEGVGLCSYLLIGFWYTDRWNAYCGMKAFVVNRIGDFGFLVGIFLLFWSLDAAGVAAVDFRGIEAGFGAIAEQTVTLPGGFEMGLPTLIGICFFIGAAGKSAQIPLYVWLPDAMAGPTPVSALIHAATMVTAGVYMVCRLSFLFAAAPGASALIAWTGALTALFAATIAITQTDIKKVLAYSTVSQLGYMFLAAGCGAYSAAMFHVVTHAFFKALLFLGAGSVILALHHEQDTDRMGGLKSRLWQTHLVFLAGVIGIAGLPYVSAGFFSKDGILLAAWLSHVPGHQFLYGIALFTAGLTAFYMFRLYFRIFHGDCRASAEVQEHIEEPTASVLVPLWILAFLSIFGGYMGPSEAFVGLEDANSFGNFLAPLLHEEPHHVEHALEWRLAALATLFVAAGIFAAWQLYVRDPSRPVQLREALGGFYRLVRDKYRIDELYDRVIVNPLVRISDGLLYRRIDAGLIDGLAVNGTGRAIRDLLAGGFLKYFQTGLAQSYLILMLIGSVAIVGYLVA